MVWFAGDDPAYTRKLPIALRLMLRDKETRNHWRTLPASWASQKCYSSKRHHSGTTRNENIVFNIALVYKAYGTTFIEARVSKPQICGENKNCMHGTCVFHICPVFVWLKYFHMYLYNTVMSFPYHFFNTAKSIQCLIYFVGQSKHKAGTPRTKCQSTSWTRNWSNLID